MFGGDADDPGDAEAVDEHPEGRGPLRGAEFFDDGRAVGEALPDRGDFVANGLW